MATLQSNIAKSSAGNFSGQYYDYFLVLDFEATCDDQQKLVPQVSIYLFIIIVFTNFNSFVNINRTRFSMTCGVSSFFYCFFSPYISHLGFFLFILMF